jgi:hypothetical protein
LLHDRAVACRTRENKSQPACGVPEGEGRHAIWLHELLKDIYGKEGQVHLLQGETGWRTPKETWMEDEREEEEEVIFVNTVRQEEDDWQEPDDSWLELDGGESEEEAGVCCISAYLRKDDTGVEDESEHFHDATTPRRKRGPRRPGGVLLNHGDYNPRKRTRKRISTSSACSQAASKPGVVTQS